MPRVVDHEQRRAELASAVWRIVSEEGVGALSVRRVGDVAGWSGGAVQYYFPTKSALLIYAFDLVAARTLIRFADIAEASSGAGALYATIMSLLPTTPEISTESEVWFAFLGLALGEPALREAAEKGHGQIIAAVEQAVRRAQSEGAVHASHDADIVTIDLVALCDGLCVQELYRPWELSTERMSRIVEERIAALRVPSATMVAGPASRRSAPRKARRPGAVA